MRKLSWATYIVSAVAIATYMFHFWSTPPTSVVLWSISGACAIFSIYSGIISKYMITDGEATSAHMKALASAAIVIGCLVLFGITLSAIFMFH